MSIEILMLDGRNPVCRYGEKWFRISRKVIITSYRVFQSVGIPKQRSDWNFPQCETGEKTKSLPSNLDEKNWVCTHGKKVFLSRVDSKLKAHFGNWKLSEVWPKARKNIFLNLILLRKCSVSGGYFARENQTDIYQANWVWRSS